MRRYYTVTMLQSWRPRLADLLRKYIDCEVIDQAYGDGSSTTWVVYISSTKTAKEIEDAIRDFLCFPGWLVVEQAGMDDNGPFADEEI